MADRLYWLGRRTVSVCRFFGEKDKAGTLRVHRPSLTLAYTVSQLVDTLFEDEDEHEHKSLTSVFGLNPQA
jgi:hypothetical protein